MKPEADETQHQEEASTGQALAGLLIMSLLFGCVFGIPLGLFSAWCGGSFWYGFVPMLLVFPLAMIDGPAP